MLNQSNQSDSSFEIERERKEQLIQRQKSIEDSLSLNVKDHMQKLENVLLELKKDLQVSKKGMGNLRLEQQTLKSNHATDCDDLSKYIISQVQRLSIDSSKKNQEIVQEVDFYDAQMKTLHVDKNKLDETANILDMRIQQCENDVGFRHVYD